MAKSNDDLVIYAVAKAFARELLKFHTKADISDYKSSSLTLDVTYSKDSGAKLGLTFSHGYSSGNVKHPQLGPLMDEVYRRFGFDEKAEMQTESESKSLLSLPSPE